MKIIKNYLIISLMALMLFGMMAGTASAAADVTVYSAKITGPTQITIVFVPGAGGTFITAAPITAFAPGALGLPMPYGPRSIISLDSLVGSTAVYTFNGPDVATDATATLFVATPTDITDNASNTFNPGPISVADGQAPVISAVTPASSSFVNGAFTAYYTLSEAVTSGRIIFVQTGGSLDGSSHTYSLAGADLTSGVHSISRADLETGFENSLVDGAVYTMTISATDAASNVATPVSNTAITYDTTPPEVVNAVTASLTTINVTFSEPIVDNSAAPGDFSIGGVASTTTVAGLSVSGSNLTLTLESEMTDADTPTVYYTKTSGSIDDLAANSLADFADQSVTNNLDTTPPEVVNAVTASTTTINITFIEPIVDNSATPGDFTITGVTSNPIVTGLSASGSVLTLTLNNPMTDADSPTVYYTKTSGSIDDLAVPANSLADFADQSVTNNLPPVITNFTANPNTHISRSNPTIISADVTDSNLLLVDFMVVDINNLIRANQTMLFRYTNESGISGKYRSLPWDGTVFDMINRDGTGNSTYTTSMYVDNSSCSICQNTIMSPVQFQKNGTTEPVRAFAWFNRSTGNLSYLTYEVGGGDVEIEDGNSTISVVKLTFPDGIDQPPVEYNSDDKTYIMYNIEGGMSYLNPVLVSEPVPNGNYKILVHAQDTADNHNGADSDIYTTSDDTTAPVITNFTANPNTHISRSNPTIISADVTDSNLAVVEFLIVDSNNLEAMYQTVLGIQRNESGLNGAYTSSPWNAFFAFVTNGTEANIVTVMSIDGVPACPFCADNIRVTGLFKKNATESEIDVDAWFDRYTFNLTNITLWQPAPPVEIENGISTISFGRLEFANGLENPPSWDIAPKIYPLYSIGSPANPYLAIGSQPERPRQTGWTFNTVPAGNYTVLVNAWDTANNYNGTSMNITTADVTPPLITGVVLNTTTPTTGQAVLVTVNAIDDTAVTSVQANGIPLTHVSGITWEETTWNGTITASAGSHSVNISASDAAGNVAWNNATTYVATTSTTTTTTTGGGGSGSGGGGGGVVTGEPFANIAKFENYDKSLIANTPVTYTFKAPELGIYEIDVTGKESENDIAFRVEALKGTSKLVTAPAPEIVYKNVNVWAGTKRMKEAIIRFKVENSWLGSNSLAGSDVKMFHWDGSQWTQLETAQKTKDDTYTYYEAKTVSLSPFAISGLKGGVIVSTATPPQPAVTTAAEGGAPKTGVAPAAGTRTGILASLLGLALPVGGGSVSIFWIIGLIIVVAVLYIIRRKRYP